MTDRPAIHIEWRGGAVHIERRVAIVALVVACIVGVVALVGVDVAGLVEVWR